MKKVIRFCLLALAFLLLLGTIGLSVVSIRGIPQYAASAPELKVEVTAERIKRGKKLASLLCQHCHFNPSTQSFTGRLVADAPAEFGKAYAPNITRSESNGIGRWSDGEIAYLLRTGIKKDGYYAPPWMPKLPLMSDEDILSIIAFLRSDDPSIAAREIADEPCEPSLLTKFLCNVEFKPLAYPSKPSYSPDTSDHVAYGRYLALGVVDCYSCHSADFKKMNPLEPEKSLGFFGGGNAMLDMDGNVIKTANITFDEKTGIGSWTKDQFVIALVSGQRPDGRMLRAPMMPYVSLEKSEAEAIYEYLKTVPKISNDITVVK